MYHLQSLVGEHHVHEFSHTDKLVGVDSDNSHLFLLLLCGETVGVEVVIFAVDELVPLIDLEETAPKQLERRFTKSAQGRNTGKEFIEEDAHLLTI